MKRTMLVFALGFIAALGLFALASATQADPVNGCPAVIARGRVLLRETNSARFSECVYSRPRETACGENALGWPGFVEERRGKKIVCVFVEPTIPETNGG